MVKNKSRSLLGQLLKRFLNKQVLLLLLILFVASAIRLYQLTTVPPGFHRDEALFGYNAYSILKTARDEHGRFLPLSFEGFGIADFPLAIYLRVPFIALFDLNVFSERFSVVFYSIITIFLIYKLARKFFEDPTTAFIAAVIATFSTWHFFMSRAGYSISMYGLMFLLLGTYLLLYGKRRWQNVAGGISLGLTCFTYAAYYFFLPLFLIVILAVFFKEIKSSQNKKLGFAIALAVTAAAFVIFWGPIFKRAPQAAFYYNDPGIIFQWSDKPVGEILAQGGTYNKYEWFLHNPRWAFVYKATMNYFDGFSPTYWFKTGKGAESNVDGFGNLLLYEPLLILVGAVYLIWKKSKEGLFLIAWVVIGPIATTFTKDVASTRLLHMVAPFILLEAVGVKYIWDRLLKLKPRIFIAPVLLIFLAPIIFLNVLYFDAYFRHMSVNAGRWWYEGYLDVVDLTNKYPQKTVYIKGKGDLAYVFVLFRNKYDPGLFQKQAKRELTNINFNNVTSFGRYNFVDVIEKDQLCRDSNSIFVEKVEPNKDPDFIPDGSISSLGADKFVYFIPTPEKCAK